jgi:hypothetical protein
MRGISEEILDSKGGRFQTLEKNFNKSKFY